MAKLEDILNWRMVGDDISTSGQPTVEEFDALAKSGVTAMINLAPYDNDNAMPTEGALMQKLGIDYIHIPVDFDAPTDQDFDQFQAALTQFKSQRLHVHCIYNARVSAFFLRHAQDTAPERVEPLTDQMHTIWKPGGVWAAFINCPSDVSEKNRYLGYDY